MSREYHPDFDDVTDTHKKATLEQYDERGNIIANNSVPLPDPKFRPETGDIATSPEQLNASAPPAPAPRDPYGGNASASRANADLTSDQRKALRSADGKQTQVFAREDDKHGE